MTTSTDHSPSPALRLVPLPPRLGELRLAYGTPLTLLRRGDWVRTRPAGRLHELATDPDTHLTGRTFAVMARTRNPATANIAQRPLRLEAQRVDIDSVYVTDVDRTELTSDTDALWLGCYTEAGTTRPHRSYRRADALAPRRGIDLSASAAPGASPTVTFLPHQDGPASQVGLAIQIGNGNAASGEATRWSRFPVDFTDDGGVHPVSLEALLLLRDLMVTPAPAMHQLLDLVTTTLGPARIAGELIATHTGVPVPSPELLAALAADNPDMGLAEITSAALAATT